MRDALLLLLALTIALPLGFHAMIWLEANSVQPRTEIIVIDGDTVESNGVRHRLIGYDTPERRGKCQKEVELAERASNRLAALVASADRVELKSIGVKDRYGRQLSSLTIDGADVGRTLIAEHLARPYHGGRRKGWCPD